MSENVANETTPAPAQNFSNGDVGALTDNMKNMSVNNNNNSNSNAQSSGYNGGSSGNNNGGGGGYNSNRGGGGYRGRGGNNNNDRFNGYRPRDNNGGDNRGDGGYRPRGNNNGGGGYRPRNDDNRSYGESNSRDWGNDRRGGNGGGWRSDGNRNNNGGGGYRSDNRGGNNGGSWGNNNRSNNNNNWSSNKPAARWESLDKDEGRYDGGRSGGYQGGRSGGYDNNRNGGGRSGGYSSNRSLGHAMSGFESRWERQNNNVDYNSSVDWTKQTAANPQLEASLFGSNPSGINFDKYDDIPVEASGDDIPKNIDSFANSNLGEIIDGNIARAKYTVPTPVQKYSIPIVHAKRDLMACAQTGSGKTAAFLLPILGNIFHSGPGESQKLEREANAQRSNSRKKVFPLALILSPTRELAVQIYDEARKFSYRSRVRPCVVYGGAEVGAQFQDLRFFGLFLFSKNFTCTFYLSNHLIIQKFRKTLISDISLTP